jgi:hypothetical protein
MEPSILLARPTVFTVSSETLKHENVGCLKEHDFAEGWYIQYQSNVWTHLLKSRVFLYFYYFLHCKKILKKSKLQNNIVVWVNVL